MQLREYALKEFWQIFLDDRPFCRMACFQHANVQLKFVFSYAMTIVAILAQAISVRTQC